jgi:thioesterase domain-containing protein/acyl carrier protein
MDAEVIPRKHRSGAVELLAFLTGEQTHNPAEMRRQASTHMPAFMVPSRMVWVDHFPLTATGKLDRQALLSLASMRHAAAPDAHAEGDAVIKELRQIWFENGVTGHVSEDDDYFDVGGNSLALISVALDIESHFGIRLPPEIFGDRFTLNILATILRASAEGQNVAAAMPHPGAFVMSHPWSMARFPPEIGRRLHDNGRWAQLQVPPTEAYSTSYPTLSSMAAELARQIRETGAAGPYVLAGHSFGGVLAFEVAHQLIQAGEQIERLILLDSHWEVRRRPFDQVRIWLQQSAHSLWRGHWQFFGNRIGRHLSRMRTSPAEPDRLAQEILAHCLNVMNDHRPQPLDTRATIFRCRRFENAFDRPELSSRKLLNPWDDLIRGPNETVWIETDHAGIMRDPEAIHAVARSVAASSAEL